MPKNAAVVRMAVGAGFAAQQVENAERERVGVGVERRHAEVAGQENGSIARIGQDAPSLHALERFVEVEAGRNRVDAPEAQSRGDDEYKKKPDPDRCSGSGGRCSA